MERRVPEGARRALEWALERLAALAAARGDRGTAERAAALAGRLTSQRLVVAVVGEFKRGKTTFVNALLGADVLPTAAVPLTSVPTLIGWGEEPGARVRYLDGRIEEIPPGDLEAFVTERGNPGNRRGVARAELTFPAEPLRGSALLVDTPGVGSVSRASSEAAWSFLREVDAAIFLTSADPPISEAEVAFLREVRGEAARLLFALNKVDLLSGVDRAEAIAYTRRVIRDAVGHDVRLHPVSARRALLAKLVGDQRELEASGLPDLERDLRELLDREAGSTLVASIAASARRLVAEERTAVRVALRSAELPAEELERRASELARVFEDARRELRELDLHIQRGTEDVLRSVERELDAFVRREERELVALAERMVDEATGLRGLAERISRAPEERLRADVERFLAEEERAVEAAFREAVAPSLERATAIVRRTVGLSGAALGLALDAEPSPPSLPRARAFTFAFLEAPTILGSLLPDVHRCLPPPFARRRLRSTARRRILELLDRHRGRLLWHLRRRLESAGRELQAALGEQLEGTIEALRRGIDRVREERGRTEGRLRALRGEAERALVALSQIEEGLGALDRTEATG